MRFASISYHRIYHYYYRSRSIKQELKGVPLHKFLLERIGVSREQQIIILAATLADIDEDGVKWLLEKSGQYNKHISKHVDHWQKH